jgi:release factor glutamine methyltransferase
MTTLTALPGGPDSTALAGRSWAIDTRSLERGHDLLRRNTEDPSRPSEFRLLGHDWTLLDGVFSPAYTPVTELFTSWLPFPSTSFLEMGCGAGVTAVMAALSGTLAVTALDISADAVANTVANVARHGVTDRVRVLRSDMFAALAPDDRYDMIFWNSNFVEAPDDFLNASPLHHAFFDPAYRAHHAYLSQAPDHLTAHGRLLLGFSSLGNAAHLRDLADAAGLRIKVLRTRRRELEIPIEFQLLELTPAGDRSTKP